MEKLHKMVDMSITEKEAEKMSSPVMCDPGQMPRYPYGLAIRLTNDELEKLGVDVGDWEVGDTFHLFCLAKVTSISTSERENGDNNCCVEMQIQEMAGESEDAENEEVEEKHIPTVRYKKG